MYTLRDQLEQLKQRIAAGEPLDIIVPLLVALADDAVEYYYECRDESWGGDL